MDCPLGPEKEARCSAEIKDPDRPGTTDRALCEEKFDTILVPVLDEKGKPVLDENGEPKFEEEEVSVGFKCPDNIRANWYRQEGSIIRTFYYKKIMAVLGVDKVQAKEWVCWKRERCAIECQKEQLKEGGFNYFCKAGIQDDSAWPGHTLPKKYELCPEIFDDIEPIF